MSTIVTEHNYSFLESSRGRYYGPKQYQKRVGHHVFFFHVNYSFNTFISQHFTYALKSARIAVGENRINNPLQRVEIGWWRSSGAGGNKSEG